MTWHDDVQLVGYDTESSRGRARPSGGHDAPLDDATVSRRLPTLQDAGTTTRLLAPRPVRRVGVTSVQKSS